MEFSNNLKTDKPYYLPILLIVSIISHFPFVLNGFGEIDATKIAVSVIDILNHGSDAALANYYFSDVIPLYILYLSGFMKLLNHDYSYLPLVMNYTNAIFGTLTVIPAFYLIKTLFKNSTVAFCSVLAFIFAPSFYQSTIIGFPHLIAFFFLVLSLYSYLTGLDHDQKGMVYFLMFVACLFLTIAFLFKSDYVLGAGIYFGFLIIRKIRDKTKITGAFLIVLISGLLFLLFRNLILGPGSGTTMSKEGLSEWYDYSLIIPTTLEYLIRQTKPIAYGAGIVTFCLGLISFIYYSFRKKSDLLAFILSWAALPTLFWLIMIGNNARHNMLTILPLIVIIVMFFYEKAPKYIIPLTAILILGNYFIVPPSSSILTPSGNLIQSNALLKERMIKFHSRAKEITALDENKIAVLGYFHNPHVIFEIMCSVPHYEAARIGREDYRIKTDSKEYVSIYFIVVKPEYMASEINNKRNKYQLDDHVFVSATYDLRPFNSSTLKTKTLDIIKRSNL